MRRWLERAETSRYTQDMRVASIALAVLVVVPLSAQTRKPVRKPAAPAAAALKKVEPEMTCPTPLGVGVKTKTAFCDVMTGREPQGGLLIKLPPHKGPVTLTFDLHNRQTYSEEQVRAHRAYARYTATVGVLTMDNTLVSRAVVQNEFRTAADLVDRITGGAGPGGVKAVAPTGTESVSVVIPEAESQVSVLGEKLTVDRADGAATYTSAGRPIAVVSHVMIEYRPGPPPKPARKTGRGGGAGR
jgi:hypothetical protein